jgi:hypothetical protein
MGSPIYSSMGGCPTDGYGVRGFLKTGGVGPELVG